MEAIILEIFRDTTLTENEITYLSGKLEKITLKRKEFLLQEGETVHSINYIHSGCLRSYFIDSYGKEHTLQFAIKDWWISDYIALFGQEKNTAVSYIECIKDATLFKISKRDFDNLCIEIPQISHLYIKKLESAFAAFQKRILQNLTLPAKERYTNFVNTYPNIEQNVKNYHIASFLGITTESLSRIRKEIANE
ncbi:Crp/Fnr family transcriptional regulator [Aureispira anguillae]|uniref:Crp/Fnr family transcriptional regulator n=1 Tax=Aureispira anguillae TaxID=2864201 RepID=A0A915YEC3_9BACT|nr:Crp/Fnr family transcriptional regulator [Aureispira anguillae]BDS11549.1 Crp/Fnr family transcriptional regulator [Aureispira anguillae]